jgi:hypothetical protein
MRRLVVVAAVLLALAVVGVVVAHRGGGQSTPMSAPASRGGARAATVEPPGPDIAAARDAAVRVVGLTGAVVRAGLISRRELIESVTTPRFGPTLADETSSALEAMLLELGERDVDTSQLAVAEQPLTASATPAGTAVRVRVWSVLVIAAPGAGTGRQVWRTVTLDMNEIAGRWLVDGWSSTPGPTPAPVPEAAFDDAAVVAVPLGWPVASSPGAG